MDTEALSYINFEQKYGHPEFFRLQSSQDQEKIEFGVIICTSPGGGEVLFPIIHEILIMIPPEKIASPDEKVEIQQLLDRVVKSRPGYKMVCEDYLIRLAKETKETKDLEFYFYEKKYQNLFPLIHNQYFRYGDHWYSAVRDVLIPMRSYAQPGARILEIGGGDFISFPSVFESNQLRYTFVGTDISYWGLRCGRKLLPNGQFIQVDSDELPFRSNGFDIIFIKGALHHQQDQEHIIPTLFSFLKYGGLLGFIEVVRDGKKSPALVQWIKKFVESTPMTSPMNESIDKNQTLRYLNQFGEILSLKERMSILRYLMARWLGKYKVKSLFISKLIVWLDDLVNKLPGLRSYWLTSTHLLSVVVRKK